MAMVVLGNLALAQAPSPEPEVRRGTGDFLNTEPANLGDRPETFASAPLTVRYNEAEVAAVIDELIGEVLGLDYTIASDVRGRISLRMSDVETRSAVLQRLRSALTALNIAMIDRGDFIAFVQGGGGQTTNTAIIAPGEPVSAGVNIAVLQLRETLPSAVAPLLRALSPGVEIRLQDDVRSLLVLSGEPAALSSASEAALLVDVDVLDGLSTGIYPLAHSEPTVLAGELRQLVRTSTDALEIIPIDRLGLLVVFAGRQEDLRRVSAWIPRLDQSRERVRTPGRRVYTVRHNDPDALVDSLYNFMGQGRGGNTRPNLQSSPIDAVQIGAASDQNIILIRGDDADIDAIIEVLELLDRPRPQVLIRAVIAEVSLTEENRLGVDWNGLIDGRVSVGLSDDASGSVSARFPGVSVVYTNTDLDAAVNALASDTELEVISRPSILTLHNQRAELQVGDQVPVVVQSAVSVTNPDAPIVNQTAYRNTGVLLTVTPQIRAGGLVEIEISQEVSGVLQTTSSGIDSPTITQRRLSSTLLVPSGEAVALGGLISTRRTEGASGVPILRDVPLLGRAFRSESQSNDRTELIILLTPTIIFDPNELGPEQLELPAALERLRARIASEN